MSAKLEALAREILSKLEDIEMTITLHDPAPELQQLEQAFEARLARIEAALAALSVRGGSGQ